MFEGVMMLDAGAGCDLCYSYILIPEDAINIILLHQEVLLKPDGLLTTKIFRSNRKSTLTSEDEPEYGRTSWIFSADTTFHGLHCLDNR